MTYYDIIPNWTSYADNIKAGVLMDSGCDTLEQCKSWLDDHAEERCGYYSAKIVKVALNEDGDIVKIDPVEDYMAGPYFRKYNRDYVALVDGAV